MKKPIDRMFEDQIAAMVCTHTNDAMINKQDRNCEVRLKDEQSQFVPNTKNIAPTPATWKVNRHKNYNGTN